MDRNRLIAGSVIATAALLAFLITFWYIFYYQPGRVTHDSHLRPDTAVRINLQPAKIQWYITKLAPGITKYVQSIPKVTSTQAFSGRIDWIHAMPYEIALLFHHGNQSTFDTTLFINTHPNDPNFDDILIRAGFFREVGWVDWSSTGLSRQGESELSTKGVLHLDNNMQTEIARNWNSSGMMSAPKTDGNHLLEVSVDNTGGALYAIHRALMRGSGAVGGRDINAFLLERWPHVLKGRLWADLTEDDLVEFSVEVQCADSAGARAVIEILDAISGELSYEFGRMDFAFEGGAHDEGGTVRANYKFYGFEAKLRSALGT